MLKFHPKSGNTANIKVIGMGGGGGNAVNRMVASEIKGVEFIAANTDSQALRKSVAQVKVQLGISTTRGLGAGGDPEIGRVATEESEQTIRDVLSGADMVFITAGMGGGTGTGGAPVVARIVRELGTLAITVVTKPFRFEGETRAKIADMGIETLRDKVDTLLVIPNQRLYTELDPETRLKDGFEKADEVLKQAVQSISDVITTEGYINVDFADVRSIMKDAGRAVMGVGQARGSRRAVEAANSAITSPLLEDVSIQGARGLLVNITGNEDLTMRELDEVMDVITNAVSQEVRTFYGQVFDNTLQDEVRVTVIATGLSQGEKAVGRPVPDRDYIRRTKMFVPHPPRNNVPGSPSKTPAYLRKGIKIKFEEPSEESDSDK